VQSLDRPACRVGHTSFRRRFALARAERKRQSCSDAGACPGNGTCSSNWNNSRLVFDFDSNAFNGEEALVKLDFTLDNTTIAKVRSEDRNKTVPLWGRRFTQHVLGTADLPFIDVDNPHNVYGIDVPGDHILYPRNSTSSGLWCNQ
jgi:hypothetical protein